MAVGTHCKFIKYFSKLSQNHAAIVPSSMQITLKVLVPENEREVELHVRDTTVVINIIFKVAEFADIKLKDNYSLYEASETLKIGKFRLLCAHLIGVDTLQSSL